MICTRGKAKRYTQNRQRKDGWVDMGIQINNQVSKEVIDHVGEKCKESETLNSSKGMQGKGKISNKPPKNKNVNKMPVLAKDVSISLTHREIEEDFFAFTNNEMETRKLLKKRKDVKKPSDNVRLHIFFDLII